MLRALPTELLESWNNTPDPAERLFGLWAVKAGLTRTTPEYSAGPRIIGCHSLHVVLAGSLELTTDRGSPTPLTEGDLFCLFPRVRYQYGPRFHHQPPKMLWLAIDGPAAAPLVAHMGLSLRSPCLHGLRTKPFLAHLPALRAAMDSGPGHRHLLTLEFLARFVGEVLGQVADRSPQNAGVSGVVERGKDLIDAHFDGPLTIGEIADRLKVDRSHFSKSFTRTTGESPARYLRRRRMNEGRRMLRETDLSVTEIALSVGYSDVVAFSRSYRRFFDVPPTADRTEHNA